MSKAKLRIKNAKDIFNGTLELFLEEYMFKYNVLCGDFENVLTLI